MDVGVVSLPWPSFIHNDVVYECGPSRLVTHQTFHTLLSQKKKKLNGEVNNNNSLYYDELLLIDEGGMVEIFLI